MVSPIKCRDVGVIALLLLFVCVFFLPSGTDGVFRIGSFNVQVFGKRKVNNPVVMSTLTEIIQRYNIILIQEIRDTSDNSLITLVSKTNERGPNHYEYVVSARLGRTTSKEQYAFLYRTNDGLTIVDTFQDPDTADLFEREPYAVKVRSPSTTLTSFVLIGVHTDPDKAVAEMNALVSVHDRVAAHWSTDNIIIMGDLNADCTYASKRALAALLLRTDTKYTWLIGDEVDTTAKSTNCAYDRFIVTGNNLKKAIVSSSAAVFHYDEEYGVNNEQMLAVSDHYPIELQLKQKSSSPARKG